MLSGDTARPYLTEGVGEDFFPGTYDPTAVDRWVRVSDRDAFAMARRLTREEGILSGGSCGTAMVAAREVVRDLSRDRRRARGRGRRAPARQRPQLPLEALQRRVDARERPAGDDRGGRPGRRAARRPPPRAGHARPSSSPARPSASATRSRPSRRYGISQLPVSEAPTGDDSRRARRLDQREGPARPRVPRPGGRRADRRRGHGPAAAAGRRVARRSTRPSRLLSGGAVGPRRGPCRPPGRRRHQARPARVPRRTTARARPAPSARRPAPIAPSAMMSRCPTCRRSRPHGSSSCRCRCRSCARSSTATSRPPRPRSACRCRPTSPTSSMASSSTASPTSSVDPEAQPWLGRAVVLREDGARADHRDGRVPRPAGRGRARRGRLSRRTRPTAGRASPPRSSGRCSTGPRASTG